MDFRILTEQEKEELLSKFSVWEKRWEEENHICSQTIRGIPSNEKGYFYEVYGNSKIAINHIPIPEGYKKKRRTNKRFNDNWVKDFYFNKYIDPKDLEGKLTISNWINETKPFWLSIDKVLALKPNKKTKVLLLDRNLMDTVENTKRKKELEKGKDYKPEYFFKDSSAVFYRINNNDLKSKLQFPWQKENNETIDYEFDVEYNNGKWYPFENGYNIEDNNKYWKDYPGYTAIGWRGPMILWKDIKKLPMITYN